MRNVVTMLVFKQNLHIYLAQSTLSYQTLITIPLEGVSHGPSLPLPHSRLFYKPA